MKGVWTMQLFSIATTVDNETVNKDYTQNITVPSYKVNEFDESDDWEDGNKKKHKYIVRTRIKGSFTMKFFDILTFNDFFETINSSKIQTGDNSGAVLITAYIQNKNITKSFYAFIDADPADTLPLMGSADYEGFEVQIEEV